MTEGVPVPTPEDPFRSPKYIALAMDVDPRTVHTWLKDGKLKGYFGDGAWKVLHSDFVRFVQDRYGPGQNDQR